MMCTILLLVPMFDIFEWGLVPKVTPKVTDNYYDIYTKLYYLLTSNSKRIVTVVRYSPDEKLTKTLSFPAYSGKDIASRYKTIIESTL